MAEDAQNAAELLAPVIAAINGLGFAPVSTQRIIEYAGLTRMSDIRLLDVNKGVESMASTLAKLPGQARVIIGTVAQIKLKAISRWAQARHQTNQALDFADFIQNMTFWEEQVGLTEATDAASTLEKPEKLDGPDRFLEWEEAAETYLRSIPTASTVGTLAYVVREDNIDAGAFAPGSIRHTDAQLVLGGVHYIADRRRVANILLSFLGPNARAWLTNTDQTDGRAIWFA